MIQVKVKKMFDDVQLPEYATPGSACFDIRAHFKEYERYGPCIHAADPELTVSTGLQFEIPENHVMLVFSRSGHGFNYNTRLANCVGVIDSDYRGELKVKLTCDDAEGFEVVHGDKIAQGMVIPYEQVKFVIADELSSTERGEGGLGSTGA
jgi:dUTP pyrophosphatase